MDPYRTNEFKASKKLPRLKARLRGLWRRVWAPIFIVSFTGAMIFIGLRGSYLQDRSKLEIDIAANQAKSIELNALTAALTAKPHALSDKIIAMDNEKHVNASVKTGLSKGSFYEETASFQGVNVHRMRDHDNGTICYVAQSTDISNKTVSITCLKIDN